MVVTMHWSPTALARQSRVVSSTVAFLAASVVHLAEPRGHVLRRAQESAVQAGAAAGQEIELCCVVRGAQAGHAGAVIDAGLQLRM
jgi:hypothetical protein